MLQPASTPAHRATSGQSQSARQECRLRSCCGRPGGQTPQLSARLVIAAGASPPPSRPPPSPVLCALSHAGLLVGEVSGIKACFSWLDASFAYDTASCCLLDGDWLLDNSLPTVPGKTEPEFKPPYPLPPPLPLLPQVHVFPCQFLALTSQQDPCAHQ